MDEIGTTDIRKLPDSGRISLSEIQGEFNKGNNLTDYYGVASGIPSSGAIKLTDFYGKEQGGGGPTVGPSGQYTPTVIRQYQTTDPNNIGSPQFSYANLYWCNGSGAGSPDKWGDEAGVYCADKIDYSSCTVRKVSVQGNSQTLSNSYPYLTVGPTQGPGDYRRYPGSWVHEQSDNFYQTGTGGPVMRISYTSFSNKTAAEYLWSIMQQGLPFYIAVSSTAKEELVIDGVTKEFTFYEGEEDS